MVLRLQRGGEENCEAPFTDHLLHRSSGEDYKFSLPSLSHKMSFRSSSHPYYSRICSRDGPLYQTFCASLEYLYPKLPGTSRLTACNGKKNLPGANKREVYTICRISLLQFHIPLEIQVRIQLTYCQVSG